jgi:hypothetical protein
MSKCKCSPKVKKICKTIRGISERGYILNEDGAFLHQEFMEAEITSLPKWIEKSKESGWIIASLIWDILYSRLLEEKNISVIYDALNSVIIQEETFQFRTEKWYKEKLLEKFKELALKEPEETRLKFYENAKGKRLKEFIRRNLLQNIKPNKI